MSHSCGRLQNSANWDQHLLVCNCWCIPLSTGVAAEWLRVAPHPPSSSRMAAACCLAEGGSDAALWQQQLAGPIPHRADEHAGGVVGAPSGWGPQQGPAGKAGLAQHLQEHGETCSMCLNCHAASLVWKTPPPSTYTAEHVFQAGFMLMWNSQATPVPQHPFRVTREPLRRCILLFVLPPDDMGAAAAGGAGGSAPAAPTHRYTSGHQLQRGPAHSPCSHAGGVWIGRHPTPGRGGGCAAAAGAAVPCQPATAGEEGTLHGSACRPVSLLS